jgi:hypothetical protein
LTAKRCLVFAIDVEPDGQEFGPEDPWHGTHIALEQLSFWRDRFKHACQSPVHFNWFFRFDPQIEHTWRRRDWVMEACPDLLPTVQREGDLTGIHVHVAKWDSARGGWVNDFGDAGWRAHCLATSADTHRAIFGAPPMASRFGHRAIWNEDVAVLKQHGIRFDLTVEPGAPSHPLSRDPHASALLPDYRRAPRVPYQPSQEDYLRPQSDPDPAQDFWMIPISVTRRPHWHLLKRPPFLVRQCLPMNLVLRPRQVWAQLASELERDSAEPLVMVLRSGDLAHSRFLANFRWVMERLSRHLGLSQWRVAGVDQAVEEFVKTDAAAAAR